MKDHQKEEILAEWNALKLEQEIPWMRLQFKEFGDLRRYLTGKARYQGKEIRRQRLDGNKRVNIIAPYSAEGEAFVRERKAANMALTDICLKFLKRIKDLKRS